jgi:hypothetical protein
MPLPIIALGTLAKVASAALAASKVALPVAASLHNSVRNRAPIGNALLKALGAGAGGALGLDNLSSTARGVLEGVNFVSELGGDSNNREPAKFIGSAGHSPLFTAMMNVATNKKQDNDDDDDDHPLRSLKPLIKTLAAKANSLNPNIGETLMLAFKRHSMGNK